MARPSDREFALKRKIQDLETQNEKLERRIRELEKQIEKTGNTLSERKKEKTKTLSCPTCGGEVKLTDLPFGKLRICKEACGWREVKHD